MYKYIPLQSPASTSTMYGTACMTAMHSNPCPRFHLMSRKILRFDKVISMMYRTVPGAILSDN